MNEFNKIYKKAEKKLMKLIKEDNINFLVFATGLRKSSATKYYNRYRKENKL